MKLKYILLPSLNTGDRPTLPTLLNFPVTPQKKVDIIKQISTKYWELGVILLNDESGAEITAIKK